MQLLNYTLVTWLNNANTFLSGHIKYTIIMVGDPNKYETNCFIPLKHEMNTEKLVI